MFARGQSGCTTTTDSFCTCDLHIDAYVLNCGGNTTNVALINFPTSNMSDQSTGTVFRSLSFYPTIRLHHIQASAFQGLRINKLNLGALDIQYVNSSAFVGVGSDLNQLVLDGNSIVSLPVGIFTPLVAVQSILLTGNAIDTLELGTFGSGLSSSLRWLSISDNQLLSIPDMLFSNLTSLVGLRLDGNELSIVNDNTLRGLRNLVWLDLSGNSITSVSGVAFADQSLLERIWLQGNQLIQLEPELVTYFASALLELIDVSYNNLSSLSTSDLQQLPASRLIYFGVSGK